MCRMCRTHGWPPPAPRDFRVPLFAARQGHQNHHGKRQNNKYSQHPQSSGALSDIKRPSCPRNSLGHQPPGVLFAEIKAERPVVWIVPLRLVDLLSIHALCVRGLHPDRPVEVAILQRFEQVVFADVFRVGHVGDRARHLEHTIMRARAEMKIVHRMLQQFMA